MDYPSTFAVAATVTPHDTNDQWGTGANIPLTNGLYIGGTGNLNVVMSNDATVLIESIPAGAILPIRVKRVKSTNTTATKIVALF